MGKWSISPGTTTRTILGVGIAAYQHETNPITTDAIPHRVQQSAELELGSWSVYWFSVVHQLFPSHQRVCWSPCFIWTQSHCNSHTRIFLISHQYFAAAHCRLWFQFSGIVPAMIENQVQCIAMHRARCTSYGVDGSNALCIFIRPPPTARYQFRGFRYFRLAKTLCAWAEYIPSGFDVECSAQKVHILYTSRYSQRFLLQPYCIRTDNQCNDSTCAPCSNHLLDRMI